MNARVIGRPKHLFSIYQKMLQQGKDFDQVMDVVAVRIVTQTVAECYNALGVVHHLWTPVPGRFKDYIAMPKANMYQSVHTSVMRENGFPLEIQIRTEEMDRVAREGIAAHWRYKEGGDENGTYRADAKLDNQLNWLRQMVRNGSRKPTRPTSCSTVCGAISPLATCTCLRPKGEVKELPMGATPLDFAYFIHSHVGHHCIGARVNNRMVPLRYNLQTGDVVEILTSKNQTPHLGLARLCRYRPSPYAYPAAPARTGNDRTAGRSRSRSSRRPCPRRRASRHPPSGTLTTLRAKR